MQCVGFLPGNCRAESGYGYMMCNSVKFCKDFGLPAQANYCATSKLCEDMCKAAPRYGAKCVVDAIDTRLVCDGVLRDVKVTRRQVIIPGPLGGAVNCDADYQVPSIGKRCYFCGFANKCCN